MNSLRHRRLAESKLREIERDYPDDLNALRPIVNEIIQSLPIVREHITLNTHVHGNDILHDKRAEGFCGLFPEGRRRDENTVDAANVLGIWLLELLGPPETGWKKGLSDVKVGAGHTVYTFHLPPGTDRPMIEEV